MARADSWCCVDQDHYPPQPFCSSPCHSFFSVQFFYCWERNEHFLLNWWLCANVSGCTSCSTLNFVGWCNLPRLLTSPIKRRGCVFYFACDCSDNFSCRELVSGHIWYLVAYIGSLLCYFSRASTSMCVILNLCCVCGRTAASVLESSFPLSRFLSPNLHRVQKWCEYIAYVQENKRRSMWDRFI